MCTIANCEDPDEMLQKAAFHQGSHYLIRLKKTSRTETHHNLEDLTFDS